MKNKEIYKHYTVEDFTLDSAFKEAVLSEAEDSGSFVEELLQELPDKTEEIREAEALVKAFHTHYEQYRPGKTEKEMFLQQLKARANQPSKTRINPPRRSPRWASWAAVITLLLAVGMVIYFQLAQRSVAYQTQANAMQEVLLPDGSTVILNVNSKLEFLKRQFSGSQREVWLNGEGFFDVKKKENGAGFIVHTQGPDIQVLGTRFSVQTHSDSTAVLLKEGSIQLIHTSNDQAPLLMQEGQLVEYANGSGYKFSTVGPDQYLNWEEEYLPITGLSGAEVLQRVGRLYGLQFEIKNEAFFTNSQKGVEGVLPTRNLDELLETLETLFGISIQQSGKTLIIE